MDAIKGSAIYNMIIGHNCSCCLCLNTIAATAAHNMDDRVFTTIQDQKNIEIIVSDMLIEVLGVELYNKISFGVLCNECLSSAIDYFKFIRRCKDNVQNLSKIIDLVSAGIKDATTGVCDDNKAVYVSVDTKKLEWNKYYSKRRYLFPQQRYKSFVLLKNRQWVEESRKRAEVQKKQLRVNVVRLDDDIMNKWMDSNLKMTKRGRKPNENKINHTHSPGHKNLKSEPNGIDTHDDSKDSANNNAVANKNQIEIQENDTSNHSVVSKSKGNIDRNKTNSLTPQTTINKHILDQPNKMKCAKCSNTYSSEIKLKQHIRSAHGPVKCNRCDLIFTTSILLKQHLKSHEVITVLETSMETIDENQPCKDPLEMLTQYSSNFEMETG